MAFLVKDLFSWKDCLKNADISIFSKFLVSFFPIFFSMSKNFSEYYLHANFQTNWTFKRKRQMASKSQAQSGLTTRQIIH